MPERTIQARTIAELGARPDWRLFRNTVGFGWYGPNRDMPVTFGLCPGSADLIGWRTINGVAQFVALECKSARGRLTPEQRAFLDTVSRAGGLARVIRTEEDWP